MILKRQMLGLLAISLCMLASAPQRAAAQSAEALAAADHLIAVQDLDAMMLDMAGKIAASLPGASEAQQRAFVTEMNSPAFLARYKVFMRIAMARHMTVDELNAMAEFYSRPIAKSAMQKMGLIMADITPFIQTEIPGIVARVMMKP